MKRASARGAEAEKEEGFAIARELAAGIAGLARGVHVLPMGRYDAVAEILAQLPVRERRAAGA
jgi:5,10-methylenetetrahydrofolate reductase